MARRTISSTLCLLALLAAAALLATPAQGQQQGQGRGRGASSLFNKMKQQQHAQQQQGKHGGEAEPVTAAEPEEGGIRFERRALAMDEAPGFASVMDADLKMIKCVVCGWDWGLCRVCVCVWTVWPWVIRLTDLPQRSIK